MSLFEEYLTLGQWLTEDERLTLYKYLLISQKNKYNEDFEKLIVERLIQTNFANGEIVYSINKNKVSYKSRKIGDEKFTSEIRIISLSRSNCINRWKLQRFFAQAELDVLRNFPIPSTKENLKGGYSTNSYPFYDLKYYSNGNGKILGLVNKLKKGDDPLLQRLLAS